MQIANILLSLGGDSGNTIPKFHVTAAEIAVLQAIHGGDAVNEIEPQGDVKRSHRDERSRLLAIYGAAKTPDQKSIVEGMFPGVAARVFETLNELDLDGSFFKATGRMTAASPAPAAAADAPELTDEQIEAEIAQRNAAEAEEGVGDDIDDEHAGKDDTLFS